MEATQAIIFREEENTREPYDKAQILHPIKDWCKKYQKALKIQ